MKKLGWTSLAVLLLLVTGNGQEEKQQDIVGLFLSHRQSQPEYQSVRYITGGVLPRREGSMEVEVSFQKGALLYQVRKESGSGLVRKMFRKMLEEEKEFLETRDHRKMAFTGENYIFSGARETVNGLWQITLVPRREDLLTEGSLLVRPSGELVQSRGKLAKNPSFWVRNVSVEITYGQIAGVRMPVTLRSIAKIRIFGQSNLEVKYKYLTVNGKPVDETK